MIICKAVCGSISLDVREGILLVLARWYFRGLAKNQYLESSGTYDHLLGITSAPDHSVDAVKKIVEKACLVKRGRRNDDALTGSLDVLDEELLKHVQAGHTSAKHRVIDALVVGAWMPLRAGGGHICSCRRRTH